MPLTSTSNGYLSKDSFLSFRNLERKLFKYNKEQKKLLTTEGESFPVFSVQFLSVALQYPRDDYLIAIYKYVMNEVFKVK